MPIPKFLSRFSLLALLAAAPLLAARQEGLWSVPRVGGETITEPSPEATAMRRYQDFPVSYADPVILENSLDFDKSSRSYTYDIDRRHYYIINHHKLIETC